MTSNSTSTTQTIQQATDALKRGDKSLARQLAQVAVSIAPYDEEPWLLLAAVSTPQASVEYIKQALSLNPESERALRALRWAQDRLARQLPPTPQPPPTPEILESLAVTRPTRRESKPAAPRHKSSGLWTVILPILFFLLMCVGLMGITLWPGNVSRALALIDGDAVSSHLKTPAKGGVNWSEAEIVKVTHTPVATATSIPTATPTQTPTALPTDIPTAENTSEPTVQAAGNGKYVLVSISEQHLYAYQDNQLVYSFVASTGMNNATRTGTFQVLDKIPNAYGATWDLWMPNWMGIYYSGTLENGIHALPILSNGVQLWSGYLGTPISYGCIVLGVDDAQTLYDWAEVGTTVEIKY